MKSSILKIGILSIALCVNAFGMAEKNTKTASDFLTALYAQDRAKVEDILGEQYIQHNQHYNDGKKALLEALKYFNGEIIIHRIFADGDFVVVHNEFSEEGNEGVGFDIFKFNNGKIVEHWDNLTAKLPPNPSGRTQTDGRKEIAKNANIKANKNIVESFVKDILMGQNPSKLADYFDNGKFIQHNANMADNVSGFEKALESMAKNGLAMKYHKIHKILGSGDFVLVVSEGEFGKINQSDAPKVAFYDLFRVENGKIAEHWDTIGPILDDKNAKNNNGKFGF